MKRILSSEESKAVAYQTISEMASVVKKTLGPGGNPIIIQRSGQNPDGTPIGPLITKDGVSVAESVSFRDPAKNTISQAILQVAKNTVNQAGDGTTTAIVLAEAIYKAGYKHMKQGSNGIQLYNSLKVAKDEVLYHLTEKSKEIKDENITEIAAISANGDLQAAQIVHDALTQVGEDGHISLEEGYSRDTNLDIIKGAVYKQGWRSFGPYGVLMVNDKSKNMVELSKPAILLYSGKLDSVDELGKFVNKIMNADEHGNLRNVIPLFIVAHEYSDEVKNFIVQSKVQGKLPLAAIKSPFDGSPNARTEMLEDLATLIGATVSAKGILELEKVTDEHLGCADRIEISALETVFYGGQGSEESVLSRVEDLKTQKGLAMHDFDRENLSIRIGKLTGGIAIIRVGGDTEPEMLERKDRIEDALCAARVAIQEGILPGGGYTLYAIAQSLEGSSVGHDILREALEAPIRQIISNVGQNPDVILSHMPKGLGYDALNRKYVDMMASGIIDPTKVTKSALENAVSIAGLLLTTGGAVVVDLESKDGQANPLAALMGM